MTKTSLHRPTPPGIFLRQSGLATKSKMAARLISCLRTRRFGGAARLALIPSRSFRTGCASLGGLDEEFNAARNKVTTLKEDPGNTAKLKLYAFFKQVSH